MKNIFLAVICAITFNLYSQSKNFIDQPYVEVSARVDTLVTPDKIFLKIIIAEKDSKGKQSVEELDENLFAKLTANGVNLKEQLTLNDVASNYKKYFLRGQDINKTKTYTLLLYDAATTGKVLGDLEEVGISNISVEKTEYSKLEELKSILRKRAALKAKKQAIDLSQPFNKKIGEPLYISDGNSFSLDALSGRVAGVEIRTKRALGYAVASVQGADIEFQKVRAQIDVNAVFKLE
jgi:uncharacterized protein YggE